MISLSAERQIEHVALLRNTFLEQQIELRLPERSAHLVLDHLHLDAVADADFLVLDGGDAANVEAHAGIELEGPAAGGGFRAAEHHADLLANLVDEDHDGLRAADDGPVSLRSACA